MRLVIADRNTEYKHEVPNPKTATEAGEQIDSLVAELNQYVDDAACRGESFDTYRTQPLPQLREDGPTVVPAGPAKLTAVRATSAVAVSI